MANFRWDIDIHRTETRIAIDRLFRDVFLQPGENSDQLTLWGWKPVAEMYWKSEAGLLGWQMPASSVVSGHAVEPENDPDVDVEMVGEGTIVIRLSLPNVLGDSLSVEVQKNVVTLSGEMLHGQTAQTDVAGLKPMAFRRIFTLPDGVHPKTVDARLEDDTILIHIEAD